MYGVCINMNDCDIDKFIFYVILPGILYETHCNSD